MHNIPGAFQKLQTLYAEGEAQIAAGDLEAAVRTFTEGIAIDDHFRQRYITMYAHRAFALQKLGRLDEAVADYTKAIELEHPEENRAQYHFHRGLALQSLPTETDEARRANVERAIADFGSSIALYPNHPGPYHLRGKLLVNELERFEEAIVDLDKVLSMRPNADALTQRGFAHFNLAHFAEARADFERAKEMAGDPYNDYMLAAVHAKLGDGAKVVEHAKLALDADEAYREYFASDDDFDPYRSDPAFAKLC